MKKLHLALSAAALATFTSPAVFAGSPPPLSNQEATRLSFSVLQARAGQLGIRSASQELAVRSILRDGLLNQTHVRLDHVYKGIPVFGEQLITHFNDQGELVFLNGDFTALGDFPVRPELSGERALELARFEFDHEESEEPRVGLKILLDEEGTPELVWHIQLTDIQSDDPADHTWFLDARTGDLVWDFDSLHTTAANGTGKTLYSGSVTLTTDKGSSSYKLSDPTRGAMYTTDMANKTRGSGTSFTDSDNVWGTGSTSSRVSGAADAQYGAAMTWDLYEDLGRSGIKGNGKGSLSRVHYGSRYNNAYWSDSCTCMTYGDGDGSVLTQLVSLDVTGHEMSHGVTSATSGLTYSGQAGGMNESFSDIIGAMVEFWAADHGAHTTGDYLIGEDIYTPSKSGDALRYMDNPTRDGSSIDNASKYKSSQDVHYTSGVTNNQFYLAAEGGTNKTSGIKVSGGIGREKAATIWWQANTTLFTSSTSWATARTLTLKACGDLYGSSSKECDVFGQAWTAVGVK